MKIEVEKQYTITCEYCLDSIGSYSRESVLESAKKNGWHTYKGENICPVCYKKKVKK